MIDISFLLLNIEEKSGGLFDFDGTLPLTIFQFILLTFILERLLFKPLSQVESLRIENLKKKTETIELTLTGANFLVNLYNVEVSNIEKKIDSLLKKDNLKLQEHFINQLSYINTHSLSVLNNNEQTINKKITGLSSNEEVKIASSTIAAIMINQIISK